MQKINPSGFRRADEARTEWQAIAEQAMMPEDLIDPALWANIARNLKPFDRVEVLANDGSWWAEYVVLDTDQKWASVQLLNKATRNAEGAKSEQQTGEFEVRFRGARKWSVLRRDDKAIMKENCQSREEAESYLTAHLKSMAA